MHAFVRSVVLRGSRTGKLHLDALFDPPKAQAGKSSQAVGGKWRTEITPDDLRQTVVTHQPTKSTQGADELLVGLGLAGEHVVAVTVAYGERVAALLITQQKPPLEVHRPHVIWLGRTGQSVVARQIGARPSPPRGAQAVAAQDLGNRAARRRSLDAVLHLHDLLQLLWPPRAVLPALLKNE